MKKTTISTALAALLLAASPIAPLCAESFLGVYSDSVAADLGAQLGLDKGFGMVVRSVAKDSPAEKAGLKEHDVLVEFNGQRLVNGEQLRTLVGASEGEATLKILRAGKEETVAVTLIERPEGMVEYRVVRRGQDGKDGQDGQDGKDGQDGEDGQDGRVRVHSMILGEDGDIQIGGMSDLSSLFSGGGIQGLGGLGEDIRKQVEAAIAEARKNLPEMKGAKNFSVSNSTSLANTVFSDGEHTLNLSEKDGVRTLKATDRDGEVLFEGPIDNKKQRAKVPAGVLEKLDKFEGMVDITTSASEGSASSSVTVEVRGDENVEVVEDEADTE